MTGNQLLSQCLCVDILDIQAKYWLTSIWPLQGKITSSMVLCTLKFVTFMVDIQNTITF